jgi:hypothetical protein
VFPVVGIQSFNTAHIGCPSQDHTYAPIIFETHTKRTLDNLAIAEEVGKQLNLLYVSRRQKIQTVILNINLSQTKEGQFIAIPLPRWFYSITIIAYSEPGSSAQEQDGKRPVHPIGKTNRSFEDLVRR